MAKKSAYILIVSVILLLTLGIVMLYSIGAFARDAKGDPFFFLKRQSFYLVLGAISLVVGSLLDYRVWEKYWAVIFGVALLFLALCFVPGIGMKINGSHRWVNLKVITFQPSEFAKFASIVFLSFWFTRFQDKASTFWMGFVAPLMILGCLEFLIVIEIDIGTTSLIGCTAMILLFVAGTRLLYLGGLAVLGLSAVSYAIMKLPERMARFMAFMDLEKYADEAGLQQWLAQLAFGSGGIEGRGLGSGRFKMDYLPYAHTDFIFPMVGEELGLYFTLLVVFCFLVIAMCGALIASHAKDRFGMLLGIGITMLITFQASINIAVTTGLMPNKGFPMPFISYGGSNLMMCLFMVGILVNIYRQGVDYDAIEHVSVLDRERVLQTRI